MRKPPNLLLPLLLQIFFSVALSWTAFGRDPVVPWPLEAGREYLYTHDIEGSWVAFDQKNNMWHVKISKSTLQGDGPILISIVGKEASPSQMGWLIPVDGVFAGKVTSNKDHEASLMIFRNLDGLYLRLETGKEKYRDLILYRVQPQEN
ncbi:MAG: hypothetical protein ACXWRE_09755 [Pseudobdellovibrionaceae bacterium]